MDKWKLEKLARVLIRTGVNLQEGETVVLQTDTMAIDLAREITKEAFAAGAKNVEAFIEDAEINHYKALNCTPETLRDLPEWKKEGLDSILRTGKGVQLGVRASRPTLNQDVPDLTRMFRMKISKRRPMLPMNFAMSSATISIRAA